MQKNRFRVGLLSFGHANAGMATYLCSRGIAPIVWAPDDHPGALTLVRKGNGFITAVGDVSGEFAIEIATDLAELVKSASFLILATRSDAHDFYVDKLEELNYLLQDTTLFVTSANGFSMIYERRLRVKYILESNTAPLASKLDGLVVNIKKIKKKFWMSCYPLCRDSENRPDFPSDIRPLLNDIFSSEIQPCVPLETVLDSVNGLLHGITAVLNIGRLKDDETSLSKLAHYFLELLRMRKAADEPGFFYAEWMNTYINNVQHAGERQIQGLAAKCGVTIPTLRDECNQYYGTRYNALREYCLSPFIHNVQKGAPEDMNHRYYCEEFIAMTLLSSIAKIMGYKDMDIVRSTMCLSQAAAKTEYPTCGRDLMKCGFTREDLARFGMTYENGT